METCSERRKRKLVALASEKGGTATIAKDCGLNPATLDQIVKGVLLPPKADGTRSERSLGDDAARMIETRYELERGWFDSDEVTGMVVSESEAIVAALGVLTKALAKADDFTQDLVRHSLSLLGKEPSKTVNISRKIADLLVTEPAKSVAAHDAGARDVTRHISGDLGSLDLGGNQDGQRDRAAASGGSKRR